MSEDIQQALTRIWQEQQQARALDPLALNGIALDDVCVVSPIMVKALREISDYLWSSAVGGIPNAPDELLIQHLTGRKTYIINDAPPDAVEYMPESIMRVRYADHFRREQEQSRDDAP